MQPRYRRPLRPPRYHNEQNSIHTPPIDRNIGLRLDLYRIDSR